VAEGDCLGVTSLANLVLGMTSLALPFNLSCDFAASADLMLSSACFKLPSKFLTEVLLLELNLDLTGFGVAPISSLFHVCDALVPELEHCKIQLNEHLDRTLEELNQQRKRLIRNTTINNGNRPILNQEQFGIEDRALLIQTRDLEKLRKHFDEDLKTAKAKRLSVKKKMDAAKAKRHYTERPLN